MPESVLEAIRRNKILVPDEISLYFSQEKWENLKKFIMEIPRDKQEEKLRDLLDRVVKAFKAKEDAICDVSSASSSDDPRKNIPHRSSNEPKVILHSFLPPMVVAPGRNGIGIALPIGGAIPVGGGIPIGLASTRRFSSSNRDPPASGHFLAPFPVAADPFNPLARMLPPFF